MAVVVPLPLQVCTPAKVPVEVMVVVDCTTPPGFLLASGGGAGLRAGGPLLLMVPPLTEVGRLKVFSFLFLPGN